MSTQIPSGNAAIRRALRSMHGPYIPPAPGVSGVALCFARPELIGLPVTANHDTETPNGRVPAGTRGWVDQRRGVCHWDNGVVTRVKIEQKLPVV